MGIPSLSMNKQKYPLESESIRWSENHQGTVHNGNQSHHHHSHAAGSCHEGGHHLLQVEGLSVGFSMYDPEQPFFKAKKRRYFVIEDLNISVHAGEIVAVVGASGSGKTLLADCLMGLFEPNSLVSGRIWLDGEPMDEGSFAKVRGSKICLVPQSVSYLDPLMKIGKQVEEFAPGIGNRSERAIRRRMLFERYGLEEDIAEKYPFELSGGMARRVLLCCALMGNPSVIVADEPTPGLDNDLVRTALGDLRNFTDATGGGVLLITHDLGMALEVADRIAVFKDGTIVEEASCESFRSIEGPKHPFSRALMRALPERQFDPGCKEAI